MISIWVTLQIRQNRNLAENVRISIKIVTKTAKNHFDQKY